MLTVESRGIGRFRLPLPPRELNTRILRAGGEAAYTSARTRRASGDCTLLAHPALAEVAATAYRCGPGRRRQPTVTMPQKDGRVASIRVESAVLCAPRGVAGRFEYEGRRWRWVREKELRGGLDTALLVLYRYDVRTEASRPRRVKVAELVRNADTRTAGSKRCSAGNGGLLLLDDELVGEVLVITTLCVILKKETDRRRLWQAIMLGGLID